MAIRVFLADDHAVVVEGLRTLLEKKGSMQVVGQAADGQTAVKKAISLKPDVVVLDFALPVLNGIDAARQILAEIPTTRIVMLSMYGSSDHIHRALQAGISGYVLKESAGPEIVSAVKAVYAGRMYLCDMVSAIIELSETPLAGREADPLKPLSYREREVFHLVVEAKTSKEIATILNLSPKSVDTYRSRLMSKLGIKNLAGLVKFAISHGLVPDA